MTFLAPTHCDMSADWPAVIDTSTACRQRRFGVIGTVARGSDSLRYPLPFNSGHRVAGLAGPACSRWGLDGIAIARTNNNGTGRSNRIALGSARQLVFSRNAVSPHYSANYFGKPAPTPYGYRIVDGKLEVKYDSSRDT
jgi:hypothetical protein